MTKNLAFTFLFTPDQILNVDLTDYESFIYEMG